TRSCERARFRLRAALGQLDSLSPLAVLGRGYSLTLTDDRRIVRSAREVRAGDDVRVLLHEGSLDCRVARTREADDRPQVLGLPGAARADREPARERQPAARGVAAGVRGGDRARAAVREVSGGGRKAHRGPDEGRSGRARHEAVCLGAGRGSVSGFELQAYLAEWRSLVDAALERALPSEHTPPPTIHRAMRYSVMAGGKRLRPILVIAGAEAVGGTAAMVLPTACALEMIHTYSLIHDDLPAMDDDDYRRGRLTSHKVFGDAVAILAGDALLTLAFRLVADNAGLVRDPRVIREAVAEIADAAGTLGMVGGQVVDIESEI